MTARIPQSVREEQLNALPGKRFVRWLDGYRNGYSKAVMVCDEGHVWQATVHNLLNNGRGCPKCARRYIYSQQERESQLKVLPGKRFVNWESEYVNPHSKAVMQCDAGHIWSASVNSLLDKGQECPTCSGSYRYTPSERVQQLSNLPNVRFVRWEREYRNPSSKAIMACSKNHHWSASVQSLIGNGTGCPACAGLYRYSAAEREYQLNALPGKSFVRWEREYRNYDSKAVMRCSEGHEWSASIGNLISHGRGCPSCATSGYDQTKPGTLYALRHEDGAHIKIGISNDYARRLVELRRNTPFKFNPVHMHHSDDGRVIADLEKAFHNNFESSGFTGFDGATEWLKFNPDILAIMRILGS